MKILITTDWYSPVVNGVVASVLNLQDELINLGHEVKILTLSRNHHSYKGGNVYFISSVSVNRIYPNARLGVVSFAKTIQELLTWSPDVIHSQCEFSTFRFARRISNKTGAPIVHTYHTIYEDYTHYFSSNEKWGKAVVSSFSRSTLKKVQQIIVPTEKVRSMLCEYNVESPINIIPSGIDLSQYENSITQNSKDKLKERYAIPKDNKVLVYVGRLAKEKNLEEIIRFIEIINRQDITLLIVGDGPYRKGLESLVAKSSVKGNIIFTGMVPPEIVANYYQLGDVFVSASNSETQGLTYAEGLASGIPALCKKDDCLVGVIVDGYNGWQYTSFTDFNMRLTELFNDEAIKHKMGQNGKKLAFSKFSKKQFAKSVENIYQKVV